MSEHGGHEGVAGKTGHDDNCRYHEPMKFCKQCGTWMHCLVKGEFVKRKLTEGENDDGITYGEMANVVRNSVSDGDDIGSAADCLELFARGVGSSVVSADSVVAGDALVKAAEPTFTHTYTVICPRTNELCKCQCPDSDHCGPGPDPVGPTGPYGMTFAPPVICPRNNSVCHNKCPDAERCGRLGEMTGPSGVSGMGGTYHLSAIAPSTRFTVEMISHVPRCYVVRDSWFTAKNYIHEIKCVTFEDAYTVAHALNSVLINDGG